MLRVFYEAAWLNLHFLKQEAAGTDSERQPDPLLQQL